MSVAGRDSTNDVDKFCQMARLYSQTSVQRNFQNHWQPEQFQHEETMRSVGITQHGLCNIKQFSLIRTVLLEMIGVIITASLVHQVYCMVSLLFEKT